MFLAAILFALSLTSSVKAGPDRAKSVILPNPGLIGCKSSNCPQMLPDPSPEVAAYPWQVSLDLSDGRVIGLTALYDQPVTIDDLQAAVDERYAKWAVKEFRTGPARIWRVEPEKFVISLSKNDEGMVQLIYLIFAAKHPLSDPVRKKFFERLDATHPDPFARKMLLDSMTPHSQ